MVTNNWNIQYLRLVWRLEFINFSFFFLLFRVANILLCTKKLNTNNLQTVSFRDRELNCWSIWEWFVFRPSKGIWRMSCYPVHFHDRFENYTLHRADSVEMNKLFEFPLHQIIQLVFQQLWKRSLSVQYVIHPRQPFPNPQHPRTVKSFQFTLLITFLKFTRLSDLIVSKSSRWVALYRSLSVPNHSVCLTVSSFQHYQTIRQAQKVKSYEFYKHVEEATLAVHFISIFVFSFVTVLSLSAFLL